MEQEVNLFRGSEVPSRSKVARLYSAVDKLVHKRCCYFFFLKKTWLYTSLEILNAC